MHQERVTWDEPCSLGALGHKRQINSPQEWLKPGASCLKWGKVCRGSNGKRVSWRVASKMDLGDRLQGSEWELSVPAKVPKGF